MLTSHGLSFGLYLIGTCAVGVAGMIGTLYPHNAEIVKIVSIVMLVNYVFQFISQLYLIKIFWTLGTNKA